MTEMAICDGLIEKITPSVSYNIFNHCGYLSKYQIKSDILSTCVVLPSYIIVVCIYKFCCSRHTSIGSFLTDDWHIYIRLHTSYKCVILFHVFFTFDICLKFRYNLLQKGCYVGSAVGILIIFLARQIQTGQIYYTQSIYIWQHGDPVMLYIHK